MEIKNRSIPLCVILTIVTLGIYGLYWFVKLTNETNALAPEHKTTSGGMAILFSILTLGIYTIYWNYKLGCKVDAIKGSDSSSGVLYLILGLVGLGIAGECLAQNELNKHANA